MSDFIENEKKSHVIEAVLLVVCAKRNFSNWFDRFVVGGEKMKFRWTPCDATHDYMRPMKIERKRKIPIKNAESVSGSTFIESLSCCCCNEPKPEFKFIDKREKQKTIKLLCKYETSFFWFAVAAATNPAHPFRSFRSFIDGKIEYFTICYTF